MLFEQIRILWFSDVDAIFKILTWTMSRVTRLRAEMKTLEGLFPAEHKRLSVKAPSLDELNVQFKGQFIGCEIFFHLSP